MDRSTRIVFLGSTGGSVLSRLLSHRFVREQTLEVLSDRACGFLDVARAAGLPSVCLPAASGRAFSEALHARHAGHEQVLFFSFYTRLLGGDFLAAHGGRIVNAHPSLLPSFKGLHGFEDTLASSVTFMGSTLHLVDAGMDSGQVLLQAAIPLDRSLAPQLNRHKLFLSQVYAGLQFVRWLREGRVRRGPKGTLHIEAARYSPTLFSPNLDADFFTFIGSADELA